MEQTTLLDAEEGAVPTENRSSPLYLVLDTSALLRMVMAKTPHPLTFKTPHKGVHFVLLEVVFQQLDEQKADEKVRSAVNAFMRDAMPRMEASGALVRIVGESLEDEVVRGQFNQVTTPGARKYNGKLDSDGLIVDCALLLRERFASAKEKKRVGLLTDDVDQCRRARTRNLPAELWTELNTTKASRGVELCDLFGSSLSHGGGSAEGGSCLLDDDAIPLHGNSEEEKVLLLHTTHTLTGLLEEFLLHTGLNDRPSDSTDNGSVLELLLSRARSAVEEAKTVMRRLER